MEMADLTHGGITFDANSDGTSDLMIFFNGAANQLWLGDGAGGFTRVTSGAVVERADASNGGIAFDVDGDGDEDLMVFNGGNDGTANELLLNDGAGDFTRVMSGAAVERTDSSQGGIAFDARGDGTADDILVFNNGATTTCTGAGFTDCVTVTDANELLLNDGAGGFTRATSGVLVERTDHSAGGIAFDADRDGDDDVMVFNAGSSLDSGGAANELLLNDGAGGFTRVTSGVFVERTDHSVGGIAFNSRLALPGGDSALDVLVFNHNGAPNELFRASFCHNTRLAALQLGFVQLEGSSTCYTCPPYSTGTLRPHHCQYCPNGRVGPSDQTGVAIRGWRPDQRYACNACAAGRFRAETQQTDSCSVCPVGRYAEAGFGECLQCEVGRRTNVDREGATSCVACPRGQTSTLGSTTCKCEPGRYNSSFGLVFCFVGDFYPERLDSADMQLTRVEHDQGQVCLPCPEECLQCDGGGSEPRLKAGYSLSPSSLEVWSTSLEVDASPLDDGGSQLARSLFRCPVDGLACSNTSNSSAASDSRRLLQGGESLVECADGHGGVLCGTCVNGWTGGFNQICEKCPDTSGAAAVVVLLVLAIVAALILYRCGVKAEATMHERLADVRAKYTLARKAVKTAQRIESEAGEAMEDEGGTFQSLVETFKIIVSNLQIIAQFPVTLKFTCAACDKLKGLMKALPAVNIDVLNAVSFDCMASIGLYSRFFFIVLSPIVLSLAVWLRARMACSQKVDVQQAGDGASDSTEGDKHARMRDATQVIFAIIFLTYPTVTSTVFTMFACRAMDQGQSFHVYDTSIDCNGADYSLMRIIAFIFLVLEPVGIPAIFGLILYKNREALSAGESAEETAISFDAFQKTVKLVEPDSLFSEEALKSVYQAVDRDKSGTITLKEFVQDSLHSRLDDLVPAHADELRAAASSKVVKDQDEEERDRWTFDPEDLKFLVKAFEPEYYWFELVNYLKKFILAGVLVFVDPGSATQLCTALVISFFFFALLCRTLPYKVLKTDRVAVVAEANLFLTVLCLLMLKINLAGELFNTSFYDSAIVIVNGVATVLPVGIGVALSLQRLATEWIDSSNDAPRAGDLIRVLESPADPRCQNRLGKVVSVEEPNNSLDPTTLAVVVKLRTTADRVKTLLLCRCRDAPETVTLTVDRTQVQRVAGKKETLRLLGGVCKQCFACGRAVRGHLSGADAEAKQTDEKTDAEKDAHDRFQHAVEDIETELHVVDEFEDGIDVKQLAVDKLRSVVEPRLQKHGLTWRQVEAVVKMVSLSQIQRMLEDPEAFLQTLVASAGPYAKRLALSKLRPAIEPHLAKQGLQWEDVLPAIDMISSIEELQAALDDPDAFFASLLSAAGPAGKKVALAKLRPLLEPVLAKRDLAWDDALTAIEAMVDMDSLQQAMEDPEAFMRELLATVGPLAKKLAAAKLRPALEPKLIKRGLEWADAMPAMELIDSIEELEAAVDNPDAFVASLLSAVGPVGKKVALAKLRPLLEPKLAKRDMEWEDAVPAVEAMADVDRLQQAMEDPEAFTRELLATVGPVGKKIAAAKLRPSLEPKLIKRNLQWADVLPALELIDTIAELEAAVDDPDAFVASLLSAVGPVGKRVALAKLRPLLEPKLIKQHSLVWEDALAAIELVDSVEEIQAAVDDPDAFMQRLMEAAGPAAKAMLIAKLRPVLAPLAKERGQLWEDIAMSMEMVSSVEDLEKALSEPAAFLETLA